MMKRIGLYIILLFALTACDDVFEFSPYQANVDDEYKHQNSKNLGELYLNRGIGPVDSFSFITIADSHNDFKDLERAIEKINQLEQVDFVVHLGDFTNSGLLIEYETYSDIATGLNYPIITCIGNHDYLSNGGRIYEDMFGAYNFSFNYKGVCFVVLDATRFESRKEPDLMWFREVLQGEYPNIVLSHVPPFDDQFKDEDAELYHNLLEQNDVILSLHGHHHNYNYGNLLGGESEYLIPGSIGKGNMCRITVYNNGTYQSEMIPF